MASHPCRPYQPRRSRRRSRELEEAASSPPSIPRRRGKVIGSLDRAVRDVTAGSRQLSHAAEPEGDHVNRSAAQQPNHPVAKLPTTVPRISGRVLREGSPAPSATTRHLSALSLQAGGGTRGSARLRRDQATPVGEGTRRPAHLSPVAWAHRVEPGVLPRTEGMSHGSPARAAANRTRE